MTRGSSAHRCCSWLVLSFSLAVWGCGSTVGTGGAPAKPPAESEQEKQANAEKCKKAIAEGLEATKLKNWDLAIQYFTEAWEADRQSVPAMFNLGLAHGKAGHHLPAICWLYAYLWADPKSENGPAVRAEIEALKKGALARFRQVIESAVAAAKKLPDADDQTRAMHSIISEQAEAGDIEGALQTNSLVAGDKPDRVWGYYAEGLRNRKEIEAAVRAADHLEGSRDEFLVKVCWAISEAGDAKRVRELAGTFKDESRRTEGELWAAVASARQGDYNPWKAALSHSQHLSSSTLNYVHSRVALAAASNGDIGIAHECLRELDSGNEKGHVLAGIALAQLRSGNVKGAKATAKEILGLGEVVHDATPLAAAILGNLEDAFAGARHDPKPIARALWLMGDTASLDRWMRLFKEDKERAASIPVAVAGELARKGDVARALDWILKSRGRAADDKDGVFAEIARRQIKAGDLSGAEKTLQHMPFHQGDFTESFDETPYSIHFCQQQMLPVFMDLSKAYASAGRTEDALRVVSTLRVEVMWYYKKLPDEFIDVVKAREKLGDAAGAKATREALAWKGWSWLGYSYATDGFTRTMRQGVEKREPKDIPAGIARAAGEHIMGPLDIIRAMETKLAR